jgi:hypothetical protein
MIYQVRLGIRILRYSTGQDYTCNYDNLYDWTLYA